MIRTKIISCALAVAAVWALSACRSAKEAAGTAGKADAGKVEWVDRMAVAGLKEGTVTSKMDFQLQVDGKSLSVGGSCNLKRDEVIQLSLVAMGFMEVGRLEFTPQYLMLINRMEREYVKVAYADVPYLVQAGVDFHVLQALFWNDLFVPGRAGAWQEQDFTVERLPESTGMTTRGAGLLQCRFVVDLLTGLIRNTTVAVPGQGSVPALNWTYRHFASVEQKSFPDQMTLDIAGGGKRLTATIALRNLKWNAKDVPLTAEPGGKYERISPDLILKQLMK